MTWLTTLGLAVLVGTGAVERATHAWDPVGAYVWAVDLKELNTKLAGTLTVTRRDDGSLYAYGTSEDMGAWGFIASSVRTVGDSLEVKAELSEGETTFVFAPAGTEFGGRWRINDIAYQVPLILRKR